MACWVRGNVLRAMGKREHEGLPQPDLTPNERTALEKRLMRRREEKTEAGKKTYQPKNKY